jgi:hypothetical protein
VDLVLALFVAVFGIGIAHKVYADSFGREVRMRHRLARRARVAIAEAHDGLVRLTGRAQPSGESLTSPVSQRCCVAFQLVVKVMDGDGQWRDVLEVEEARPFTLVDESGQAAIDTAAGPCSISLVPDRKDSSSIFRSESNDLRIARALLRSRDVETETILGRERGIWFTEAVLLAGAEVAVGGQCAREVTLDGDRAGYREVPQRLVVRGTAQEPLMLSNWRAALEAPERR